MDTGRGMRNPPNNSGGPMGRMMGNPADHMGPMNRQRMHGNMNIGMPLQMDGPPLPPAVMSSMLQVMFKTCDDNAIAQQFHPRALLAFEAFLY